MLIAAVIFICLIIAGSVGLAVLTQMQSLVDHWSHQLHRGINMHLALCLVSATFYAAEYALPRQVVVEMSDGGTHLILRNMVWLVSTPIQWYIFGVSFTKAVHHPDLVPIYVAAVLCQVFGILMITVSSGPAVFFSACASCVAFGVMFWLAFQLPLTPETVHVSRVIRVLQFVTWSGYPFVSLARHMGWVSEWTEQIVLYTFLDCTTKCITCSSVVLARLVLTVASIDGTMQFVLATHDLVLVVDEAFRLLDSVQNVALLNPYFDQASQESTLLQRCINEEHADRLRNAARLADSQPFGKASPKCTVTFQLRGGYGEVLAECLVSKCAQKRRVIGVAVTSVSGHGKAPHMVIGEKLEDEMSLRSELLSNQSGSHLGVGLAPRDIGPVSSPVQGHMNLTLALHNCASVLQLTPEVSEELRRIFIESQTRCALFCFDSACRRQAEVVIVAASSLFGASFPGLTPPHPLSAMVDESTVWRLVATMNFEELSAYQLGSVTLRGGVNATVNATMTVVPLNRLSSTVVSDSLRLGVLMLDPVSPQTLAPRGLASQPGPSNARDQVMQQRFWYNFGDRLLCVRSGNNEHVTPPVLVRISEHVGQGYGIWHIAFAMQRPELDDGLLPSPGAGAQSTRPVLAVAWDELHPGCLPPAGEPILDLTDNEAHDILLSAPRPDPANEELPPEQLIPLASVPSSPWVGQAAWLKTPPPSTGRPGQ